MSIHKNSPALGGSAGLLNTSKVDAYTRNIKQKNAVPQAEFETISCRSLRAAALRECLKYEALRVIATAVTACGYLADEDDPAAIEAFRRLWRSLKTDIAIPAAELDRLGGGL
jgi:hypothetical protein